jgi:hypothetical protein
MADGTRRLLTVALFAGAGTVLFATFSTSGHMLTLALGTLFATFFGTALLMNAGSSNAVKGAPLVNTGLTGSNLSIESGEEQLPDPLAMNFDVPL